MSKLEIKIPFALLLLLAACGRQVVEFKLDGGSNDASTSSDSGRDGTLAGDGSTLAGDGSTLAIDGSTLAIDGSTLAGDGSTLAIDGSTLAIDGSTLAIDGSTLAIDGSTLAIDGSVVAIDGSVVAIDGSVVVVDGGSNLAPTVTSTLPAANATGVALNSSISASFSKAMNPATLDATTFIVMQGSSNVTGTVTYAALTRTATFAPSQPLSSSLVYTVTITTGARDTGGLALAASYVWHFTTAGNSGPPTVDATTPINLATNVSINTTVTATFGKAMDPLTINSLTFVVKQGLVSVTGVVTLDPATNTATFTPTVPLMTGVTYTVTITTGAKDLGGTPLASSYTWSFMTGACGQLPVVLGAAGNFAVLGGSTVTNTGMTFVTGDLGVSPGSAITGFPPGIVIGTQHPMDSASALGIAALTIAYNDAKGRTLCPVLKAGNLGGTTLTPGLYKSTDSLAVSSGDLTLDGQGDSNAVFIFQMATTFMTGPGRQIILSNNARAANIFWQVGTSATIGTTSVVHGTFMADQSIAIQTGATLDGRALARIGAVTLDTNMIMKPTP